MDLSKAFDTLPHDLIAEKFRGYGADDNTSELISSRITLQIDVKQLDY